jgi:hypothetical protein
MTVRLDYAAPTKPPPPPGLAVLGIVTGSAAVASLVLAELVCRRFSDRWEEIGYPAVSWSMALGVVSAVTASVSLLQGPEWIRRWAVLVAVGYWAGVIVSMRSGRIPW